MGVTQSKETLSRKSRFGKKVASRKKNGSSATEETNHTSEVISIHPASLDDKSATELDVRYLFRKIEGHQNHSMAAFDLVASNSFCSAEVRAVMSGALMNSYCIGLPGARFYGGCSDIDEIELKTKEVVCELYGAKYCEVQLLSGMMANIAAYNAMLPHTGCTVMASPSKHGGHYSHNAGGPLTRLFGANVVQTPWDQDTYNVDVEALPQALEEHKPTLLILGWSEMLFEHDLPSIRKVCDLYNCKIMYDMSHVAGLVAGGAFQRDMMRFADIVTSSTGKTLHSSDHGLVIYNDASLTPKIREAVMPLLTSNTHFHETAALCMTMLEMKEFGADYSRQVVANTQALAKALEKRQFKILCRDLGYSSSHELIVDLEGMTGAQATKMLNSASVFVNPQELPSDTAETGATGLRLGTQVLTRRGFKEKDMAAVARAMSDVLKKDIDATTVSKDVAGKSANFDGVSFAFGHKLPSARLSQQW